MSKPSVAIQVFTLIFSGGKHLTGPNGRRYTVTKTAGGLRQVKTPGWLFIEQNPHKPSKWGKMAKEGHKIMWVIRRADNKWFGRVVDGVVQRSV